MAIWLKQSTAATISFGPALLNSDGVTYVTNLTGTGSNQTENTSTGIRISKNGGALAARHATAGASNYDAFGMYLVPLDTTDTNTCGVLRMTYGNAAAFCPIFQDFMVVPANVYDSLVGGTDALDVSLIQWLGTAPLALSSQQVQAVVPTTQKVDVETIKTNPVANGGTFTFPTNSTGASTTNITSATGVTVSTNSDKTGYALTAAYDAAKTASTQTSVDDLPTNAELATALAAGVNTTKLAGTTVLGNGTAGNLWRG